MLAMPARKGNLHPTALLPAPLKCVPTRRNSLYAVPVRKSNLHPIALLPAPFKCVPTRRNSLYAVPVRKSNLHPIAVLQPASLKCVLKLPRINRTTVVVARIPDFAAYYIDGGQDWTTTVISFDIMIILSAPQGNVCERQPFHPEPQHARDVDRCK